MENKNKMIFIFFTIITIAFNSLAMAENFYTGQWDSNAYNLLDHPKTVALRVEVLDSETRLPLEDVQVLFKGTSMTEERTSRHPDGEQRAQEQEFELSTRTEKDGIAIVALGWQKEYPWRYGTDEIEKVQLIEIVRRGYHFVEQDTPFKRFLDVGQNKNSDSQEPRFFNVFEETWAKECSRSDVKFCTLRFSKNFSDLDNKNSTQSEFFEKIRNKEWGIVYEGPINRMQWEDKNQRLCGPYLIYTVRIYMNRVEDGYLRRESKPRSDNYQKKDLDQISDSPLIDSHKAIDSFPKISKTTPQDAGENNLETVTNSLIREIGLPFGTKGVAVKRVIVDSDAARAGITSNIVIESIDSRIILDVEMLISKIAKKRDDDQLLLGIWKKKSTADWERKNLIVYVSALRSLCNVETLANKHIQDGGNRSPVFKKTGINFKVDSDGYVVLSND